MSYCKFSELDIGDKFYLASQRPDANTQPCVRVQNKVGKMMYRPPWTKYPKIINPDTVVQKIPTK